MTAGGALARGPSREHLALPFFDDRHRAFAERVSDFAAGLAPTIDHKDADKSCRKLVADLGKAGFLDVCCPPGNDVIDSRLVCIARESLAWHDGLADFALAMQGLGTGAVSLAGSEELKATVLSKTRAGQWLAAFALSERDAGSDLSLIHI